MSRPRPREFQESKSATSGAFPSYVGPRGERVNVEVLHSMDFHRARNGFNDVGMGINRPQSAQGRFVNTGNYGAPPGLQDMNKPNDILSDPAMVQALQTLSAAGNLTPQQIQQIQMQLAMNTNRQPMNAWDKKPNLRAPQPRRDFAQPTTSPQHRGRPESMTAKSAETSPTGTGGESPVRSALLEEFRNNKNRKYELRVNDFHVGHCW